MPDRLTILVPAYNERATIGAVLDRLFAIDLPIAREIIVVDDASTDGTREQLEAAAARHSALRVLRAERNAGKGAAVRLGLAHAGGTIVTIQDADLELDPAQLADLLGPILDGTADVVYGSRFLAGRGATPLVSYVANRALTWATNALFGASLTDMETCYKMMRADIARGLRLEANGFELEPEITARLLRGGHRIVERPIGFSPRSRDAGKKIHWQDGVTALRVLWRERRR